MARVALCQDVMVEYMGFMLISSYLKQEGHTVELFFDDQTHEERFIRELERFQPDVVGFSILSPSVRWALRTATQVKDRIGAVTVFGNVHAIMSPNFIENAGVDIICQGEGEYCMRELCDALDAGRDYTGIEGFWVKKPDGEISKNPMCAELVDMDAMPSPDRVMYDKYGFFRHSPYLRVLAGRGCPFRCTFCSNPVLMDHYGGAKQYVRKKTPQNAIREIEEMVANHPRKVKFIFFIDEVFWVKNDWLREFLTLYKERIGIPFNANFRFGGIQEEDIKLLADSGATIMNVAIETGSEEQRKGMMNKPFSDEQILQVTDWMHKHGIRFGSSAFFGMPGDTFENLVQRLEFYRKVNPLYLYTTFFQPYPGLALTQHEEVQKLMPANRDYGLTVHHEMYLDLPDKDRMTNLKKVYFLCMKFPRLSPVLLWLTKFRIPLLFDALFVSHFTYYVFRFERISFFQWFVHMKVFAINPILRKRRRSVQDQGQAKEAKVAKADVGGSAGD